MPVVPVAAATAQPYPMDNDHATSGEHHAGLSKLLDPFTFARLRGLRDPAGAICLEVGAGAGSVALWLADRVGDTGTVLALDLKPARIPHHPQLSVLAHDLRGPIDPLAPLAGRFDLIHARLVLAHLPNRRTILYQLANLLAPGGVLLVQDWCPQRRDAVVAAPSAAAGALYLAYQQAVSRVFDAAGTDPGWARQVHTAMREENLARVETIVHGHYWTGGGPALCMITALLPQLRSRLLAHGLTHQQLELLPELLADPRLVVRGHLLYSTSGRRTARAPGNRRSQPVPVA